MSNKKTKKVNLPTQALTPVQKIEKVLLENSIAIGVQAIHTKKWRKWLVEFVARVLKVKVAPFIYSIKESK